MAKLAEALSAAGLSVWWDTAIEGGSAFAKDIARELDAADVVVVVWSATSVDSAWVLDEAGAGRDRKRLVPVQLDSTLPPLGFRQLQAIDLSGWRGRAGDPKIAALVGAIARVAGSTPAASVAPRPKSPVPFMPWLVAALVLVAALAAGWHFLGPRFGTAAKPVVAVLPFTDMSQAKGKAYFAEGLAEEILDTLAHDARLKVLGGTTARAIRDNSADPDFARDKLGVTRLLEGSVRGGNGADSVKVSVRLIDTADGSEIWSQTFDRSGTDVVAVQEEVAQAVAVQLAGPLGGNAQVAVTSSAKVPPVAYEKVLIARQLLRSRQTDSIAKARVLANEAVALAPEYAPAYSVRSQAIALAVQYLGTPTSERSAARHDAETAIRLDPNLSDGYAALGRALRDIGDYRGAAAALNRSLALKPDDSEPRFMLGTVYRFLGENNRAVAEYEKSVAIDPLWTINTLNLAQGYVWSGRPDKARTLTQHYRSMTPNAADADIVESSAALDMGEYARSLKLANAALARNAQSANAANFRRNALIAMMAANQLSPTVISTLDRYFWEIVFDGQIASGADLILKQGPSLWDDVNQVFALSYALVQLDRSAELVKSFDSRFTSVASFLATSAADPYTTLSLAPAFDRVGRQADARALRSFARTTMLHAEANGTAASLNASNWAYLLLSEGNRAGALAKLEAGVGTAWWQVCGTYVWIGDLWWFAPLNGDPRFEAVKGRCRAEINKQRKLAGLAPAVLK